MFLFLLRWFLFWARATTKLENGPRFVAQRGGCRCWCWVGSWDVNDDVLSGGEFWLW